MYSYSADGVVDVEHIVEEPYAKAYKHARYSSDDDSSESVGNVTARRDCNQTRQRCVKTHTDVGMTILDPREDHTYDRGDSGSNSGRQKDRSKLFNRCRSRAVKSVPAEPENEYAQSAKRDVVTGESADLDLAVLALLELTDTGAEDLRADKG